MKIELDTIYNVDCLQGMSQIPDATIDAVICDLPYGTTRNSWDSVIPLDALWAQYRRITKPNAAICLFSQQPFTSALVMSNPDMFKYEWIWEKEQGSGFLNANYAPLKIHENVVIFSTGAASPVKSGAMTYNPQYQKGRPYTAHHKTFSSNYGQQVATTTVNDGRRHPVDIINFARDAGGFHPTQKPVSLVEYLVRTYTNEGDVVLDNCIGSGTTAIACYRARRHYIGFETNKEYYDKAVRRVKDERRQLLLF